MHRIDVKKIISRLVADCSFFEVCCYALLYIIMHLLFNFLSSSSKNTSWEALLFIGFISATVSSVIFVLTPFLWLAAVIFVVLYKLLKEITYLFFPSSERGRRALYAIGFAVSGLWLSLVLSEKPYISPTNYENIGISTVAGFPFTALYYSHVQSPALESMLFFVLNCLVWLASGMVIGFLVPRSVLYTKYVVCSIGVVSVALMLGGSLYLIFVFD
jgi:hypothetical protein